MEIHCASVSGVQKSRPPDAGILMPRAGPTVRPGLKTNLTDKVSPEEKFAELFFLILRFT